ncbi:amidohydrolase [Hellea balneolensis]|uniref:amidohydrolase n=1 Tax=Hellea balneolensis TaxID=287478 RepID=UPI0003F75515|nr:amidohydrolase [Hellea balneolensis]
MTKKFILLSAAALLISACAENTTKVKISDTDWCFSGGPIYTATDAAPIVEAVAVKNGTISYSGAVDGDWCESNTSPSRRTVNLFGAAMYPGLTDGHGHLIGIGLREMTLNLEGTKSVKELKSRLTDVIKVTPKGETVYGRGWIETHWPEKRFPNRYDLDSVSPDHPVILERADGHAVVVNSKALEMANITANTKAPYGGAINKNGKAEPRRGKNEPSGMLIDNAAKLVEELMPELTEARKEEAYIKGAALYASRGWTNIHSMSVNPIDIPMLNRLADEGRIKIRVYNSIDLLDHKNMPSMRTDTEDENPIITTRAIKLYADGALGSRGAALLQPYTDDKGNSGLMTLKEEQANSILRSALRNGTQVNIHAIGDRGNREVLRWYKEALDAVPVAERANPDPRWRIEHSQIIHVDDIPLFAEYGIIPSMQPSHAIGDLYFAVDRLGKDRLAGGYAWRSLIDSGAIIAGGSDAPVEVGDPRIEFYAATQRKGLDGYSNEAWYPDQKVSPQEALKMFTAWPAYAAFQEDMLGTIEIGKAADFTVFETDIMTASGPDILNAEPIMTIVGGEVAFER